MPAAIIVFVIAIVAAWTIWRLRVRAWLGAVPAQSYVLPQRPEWSLDRDGKPRDRTLGLASAVNLRDIGGYPARDGKRIKWGLVFRSGRPTEMNDVDARQLASRGLKLICDFRSTFESEDASYDAGFYGARLEKMPLEADHSSLRRLRVAMFQPGRLKELMRESYTDLMLERNAPLIGRFLRLISDESHLPVLFHCTAGKDRTGITAMILMSLLGVPDEVITADYSLSNKYYEHFRRFVGSAIRKLRWLGLTVDDLRPLLIADPSLLRDALASVRAKYGSVETYVTKRCGVDASTIAELRRLLLEDV
ncbi:MAG: tyrosine-protein phosphatase [Chloroflexi bacterium]|nr:tyrosine-protein phosphatase [Chloroflexota bacterium]